jgi:hypothetical protein
MRAGRVGLEVQTVRRQMRATDVDSYDNVLAETVNGPNKPN